MQISSSITQLYFVDETKQSYCAKFSSKLYDKSLQSFKKIKEKLIDSSGERKTYLIDSSGANPTKW